MKEAYHVINAWMNGIERFTDDEVGLLIKSHRKLEARIAELERESAELQVVCREVNIAYIHCNSASLKGAIEKLRNLIKENPDDFIAFA